MSNPSKAKGTAAENEIVLLLADAGFPRGYQGLADGGVKRLEGGYESHDIQGVGGWIVEVKHRKAWHLFAWIERIRKRASLAPWVIFAIHGDRNTKAGRAVREVAIMDARWAAKLIYHWEQTHG